MRKILFYCSIVFISTCSYASEPSGLTDKLNGTDITYTYSGGWSFNTRYEEKGVSYRFLNGSAAGKWLGPFSYRAFEVSEHVFLTSWYDPGREDYVTHLINLNTKMLYGSVFLQKKDTHFESAVIKKMQKITVEE